nr:MAG TPA: SEX COMB ON MIDLEG-LIKE PROTEIN METHYLATED PEPTIDES, MBT REPEATS [Caudoviricetes sp.]DAL95957.1 MAG TPA: SEX COMB ON MIDLEG-LIKE PROTEIN METHYLATED PEPTIDES, MBT REPEATS [Caudoviricetes sp.]
MNKCPYLLPCGWCTKFDCPCSDVTEKGEKNHGE